MDSSINEVNWSHCRYDAKISRDLYWGVGLYQFTSCFSQPSHWHISRSCKVNQGQGKHGGRKTDQPQEETVHSESLPLENVSRLRSEQLMREVLSTLEAHCGIGTDWVDVMPDSLRRDVGSVFERNKRKSIDEHMAEEMHMLWMHMERLLWNDFVTTIKGDCWYYLIGQCARGSYWCNLSLSILLDITSRCFFLNTNHVP